MGPEPMLLTDTEGDDFIMNEKKKTSPIIKAAIIIGVIIIPLMYSYFYLGAFWDPYARLDDVPVAVVNLDKGSEINGEMRNLGDEICDELAKDGSLGFVFTDQKNAEEGVLGDDYYASITIPEDFSKNVATVSGDADKIHSSIIYTANQKKNYLAAQILENAMPTIKEKMNSTIDGEIIETLSDKLNSVPGELGTLEDGLSQINDGAAQLKDGTAQLKDGTVELSTGADQLLSGAGELQNGTSQLKDKAPALTEGMDALDQGAGELSQGLNTLKGNNDTLNNGAGSLAEGAGTLAGGISSYTAGVDQAGAGAKDLKTGIESYTAGVSQASGGADKLYSGIAAAGQGISQMSGAVSQAAGQLPSEDTLNAISGGAADLSTGITNFSSGYSQALGALKEYQQATGDPTLGSIVEGFDALGGSIGQLESGASAVSGGVSQLTSGISGMSSSVYALSDGLSQLETAFGSADNPDSLIGGAAALSSGLTQIKGNNDALTGGIGALSSGLDTLTSNSEALNTGAEALKTGSTELKTGLSQYTAGVSAASDGSDKLKAGTATAKDGAETLESGAAALDNGARELKNGISELDAGTGKLADGASALNSGAGELASGTSEAKTGVTEAITDTKDQLKALNGLSEYGEEPVKTETEYVEPVANYGSAFAPYFMGLSLWVGCLMIYFGIYLDYERRIKLLSKDSDRIVLRTGAFALISAAQAILLALVIKDVLHITINNPAMLFASCILVSVTFMTVVQFCLINLGDAGKFLAMLLLILQLTSCAGTFPIETQSGFFRAINKVLPMTYSTQLFKEAISGTAGANAGHSALILAGFAAAFLALTLIMSHSALKKDLNRINHEAVNKLHELKAGA